MLITHEREKLADAIVFFVKNTRYCGITKLFKLLFFLDFTHFRETGRSVTGLQYVTWPKGPAPEALWHEIKGGLADDLKSAARFEEIIQEESAKRLTKIVPLRPYDGKHLTKREQRIMALLAEIYRDATADQIAEVSHLKGEPWDRTKKEKGMGAPIDYGLALDGSKGQLDAEELNQRIREKGELRKRLG